MNELNYKFGLIKEKYEFLSREQLKIAALLFMLSDHIGYMIITLYPDVLWQQIGDIMRGIGRYSFPVFAYMIVEGFRHTSNVRKYEMRLLIWAIISEIPFDLMLSGKIFDPSRQNVMLTFLLAVIMLDLIETVKVKFIIESAFLIPIIGFITCVLSAILKTDYYISGIIMIFIFYYFAENYIEQIFLYALLFLLQMELTGILAIVLIMAYNGKKSNKKESTDNSKVKSVKNEMNIKNIFSRYFFYGFYPAHMLVIGMFIIMLK